MESSANGEFSEWRVQRMESSANGEFSEWRVVLRRVVVLLVVGSSPTFSNEILKTDRSTSPTTAHACRVYHMIACYVIVDYTILYCNII